MRLKSLHGNLVIYAIIITFYILLETSECDEKIRATNITDEDRKLVKKYVDYRSQKHNHQQNENALNPVDQSASNDNNPGHVVYQNKSSNKPWETPKVHSHFDFKKMKHFNDIDNIQHDSPKPNPPNLDTLYPPNLGTLYPPNLDTLNPPNLGPLYPPNLGTSNPPTLSDHLNIPIARLIPINLKPITPNLTPKNPPIQKSVEEPSNPNFSEHKPDLPLSNEAEDKVEKPEPTAKNSTDSTPILSHKNPTDLPELKTKELENTVSMIEMSETTVAHTTLKSIIDQLSTLTEKNISSSVFNNNTLPTSSVSSKITTELQNYDRYQYHQEPLVVKDSTFERMQELKAHVSKNETLYDGLLDTDWLQKVTQPESISDTQKPENMGLNNDRTRRYTPENRDPSATGTDGNPDQDSGTMDSQVNRQGKRFLYGGAVASRTKKNCYIVQLEESFKGGLEAMRPIETLMQTCGASLKHRYDSEGLMGFSACFPQGELPISLLGAINGIRFVERDQYLATSGMVFEQYASSNSKQSIPLSFSSHMGKNLNLKRHLNHEIVTSNLKKNDSEFLKLHDSKSGEKGKSKIRPEKNESSTNYQEEAPWQLSRLNSPKGTNGDGYSFSLTGQGVNVYIIDSGLMTSHEEFREGRASVGYSIFGSEFPRDCSGHGTQVASVIAGVNVGVAKQANVIGVQVLDCNGQGENSSVIAALNWVIMNHKKPAVINMSVGGSKSISVDNAVNKAVARGIPVIVAAGNSAVDACNLSPSGAPSPIVVGASTRDNQRAQFSNFGSCVDIFAPGRHILTAAIPEQAIPGSGSDSGFSFVSGTSLSAPIVTGIYALILESLPNSTPAELRLILMKAAASGFLKESSLMGAPNLLAQSIDLKSSENPPFITFLPRGTLPKSPFGGGTASVLEIILISASGVLGAIIAAGTVGMMVHRRVRRRHKKNISKIPSVFR